MAQIKFEVAPLGTAANGTWNDLTPYIAIGGLKWTRSDIDAAGSGRETQDGLMHRHRVAQKARFDVNLRLVTYDELHTVLSWVQAETFLVKFTDLISGTSTIYTVYSNNIPATFKVQKGNTQYWAGISIPFIEM